MIIRKAKKEDWIDIWECSCGYIAKSGVIPLTAVVTEHVMNAVFRHEKHPDVYDDINHNGTYRKKIKEELDSLLGANGEVYIIEGLTHEENTT